LDSLLYFLEVKFRPLEMLGWRKKGSLNCQSASLQVCFFQDTL